MYHEKNFIWVIATEAPPSGAEGATAVGLGAPIGVGLGGRSPPDEVWGRGPAGSRGGAPVGG